MNRRIDLASMHSPFLVRARLKSRDAIVAQMADDFRIVVTRRGSVDADDLELLGWTQAQITSCSGDARRRALADELRRAA